MAKCGKSKSDSHICRNLHKTIKTFEKVLPVEISYVPTTLRLSRKRPTPVSVQHPVLHLSSWAEVSFNRGGHYFMQGKTLDNADDFSRDLVDFWVNFSATHTDFQVARDQWHNTIPICLHGDEGRGRMKRPVMVMSAQCLLPLRPGRTNTAGPFSFASQKGSCFVVLCLGFVGFPQPIHHNVP